ncbi:MAG: helix-turn-helix transcriptional regulator, partial [Candidatus Omnitrophica bacterium]|nr:helix-turn-helix transcriptional regulator [Candidatus Omnitrophota bacterium]
MTPGPIDVREKIHAMTAIRKALGWSEEYCAHQLGITYSTLNRWERGESLPKSRLVLEANDHFISKHSKG